ncbi:peptidase inhibitor family I36 protein [Nocardia huaxiensis]|uniref:Peptidase inhibitor family I36 protein n=1 Tax=Nocardia huaxiensis TaxID=2755382 RepID=A0A7D6ZZE6_9NOCA|nr:peptidase inhibitor family I36 protein [Nocardia huaxiensis]QLY32289.1 peptidase inhibitor family I36 protein [Nocardia huaxiensis]UFS94006.1 peptidase inhibitor family I36 protein [Nocardia huaxiensis]
MGNVNRAKDVRRLAAAALAAGALAVGGTVALAAPAAAGYDCPGGVFCGYDGRDGTGSMIFQYDSSCVLHDIGNGGVGDRLTSYWNRSGKTAWVYNWTGTYWQELATIPDGSRGNLPSSVDNIADAVKFCTPV